MTGVEQIGFLWSQTSAGRENCAAVCEVSAVLKMGKFSSTSAGLNQFPDAFIQEFPKNTLNLEVKLSFKALKRFWHSSQTSLNYLACMLSEIKVASSSCQIEF